MNSTSRTYYKALFLLIVFSVNTAVSFACSVSDLFHGIHHHNSAATQKHKHADNVQHAHAHDSSHHEHSSSDEKQQQDCCSSAVTTIQKVEKSLGRTIEAPKIIFFTSFLFAYSSTAISFEPLQTFAPDYVRWRLPTTIPDLRIVIQSFQI